MSLDAAEDILNIRDAFPQPLVLNPAESGHVLVEHLLQGRRCMDAAGTDGGFHLLQ